MSAHDDDRFGPLRASFAEKASEHDGVDCVVNPGISGLQPLLAKVNGHIDETALQEALDAKGWEASKSFTFDELCELHNILSAPATVEETATCPELPKAAGNTMSPKIEESSSPVSEASAVTSKEAASMVTLPSVPPHVPSSSIAASQSVHVSAANSDSSSSILRASSGDARVSADVKPIIDVPVPCNYNATLHETAEREKVVFFSC